MTISSDRERANELRWRNAVNRHQYRKKRDARIAERFHVEREWYPLEWMPTRFQRFIERFK